MIISVVNQKGGVGKTTTTVNIAACLAMQGKKVLLVDSDPQGNATSGLGIDKKELASTMYDLYCNDKKIIEVIIRNVRKNLDLIPANIQLAAVELELAQIVSRETICKNAIAEIKDDYDFILIDCPPSLSLLTVNALTASDGVLIPIQSEFYALEGLTQLLETIRYTNYKLNPDLQIFGALITMYDKRTQLARQVADEIRTFFKQKAFKTVIPRNVRLSEAPGFGMSIVEFDKHSRGAKSYLELTKEIIARADNK